jgi:hypothetical protein
MHRYWGVSHLRNQIYIYGATMPDFGDPIEEIDNQVVLQNNQGQNVNQAAALPVNQGDVHPEISWCHYLANQMRNLPRYLIRM